MNDVLELWNNTNVYGNLHYDLSYDNFGIQANYIVLFLMVNINFLKWPVC